MFQVYEARSSLQHRNRVIVSVIFTNLMQNQLKELEFNVLDSLNTKLVRTVSLICNIVNLTEFQLFFVIRTVIVFVLYCLDD